MSTTINLPSELASHLDIPVPANENIEGVVQAWHNCSVVKLFSGGGGGSDSGGGGGGGRWW